MKYQWVRTHRPIGITECGLLNVVCRGYQKLTCTPSSGRNWYNSLLHFKALLSKGGGQRRPCCCCRLHILSSLLTFYAWWSCDGKLRTRRVQNKLCLWATIKLIIIFGQMGDETQPVISVKQPVAWWIYAPLLIHVNLTLKEPVPPAMNPAVHKWSKTIRKGKNSNNNNFKKNIWAFDELEKTNKNIWNKLN